MKIWNPVALAGVVLGFGAVLTACSSSPPRPAQVPVSDSRMSCGQADILLDPSEEGDLLELTYLGKQLELEWVSRPAGDRYEAPGNDSTWFRPRGKKATLVLDGMEFPTCLAAGAVEKPFTATGNEPFWRVIIEPGQLVLERPSEPTEALRYETVARSESGRRFRASREGLVIEVVTAPQLCRDSMSGMPHPVQVRLSINGEVSSGCGGDPKRLLMGTQWRLQHIAGRELLEKTRATIRFMPDSRIAGTGSCNRYSGRWLLNGETLEIGNLAPTRKACPPEVMAQEQRFLSLFEAARTFDISPRGELVISTDRGVTLRATEKRE